LVKVVKSIITPSKAGEQTAKAKKQMNAGSSNHATLAIKAPGPKSAMDAKVDILAKQLIEKLEPFLNAKHPDDRDDPHVLAFEEKMKEEAEKMKLEGFGVEVLFPPTFPIKQTFMSICS
jgi:hypothetical protein